MLPRALEEAEGSKVPTRAAGALGPRVATGVPKARRFPKAQLAPTCSRASRWRQHLAMVL